MRIQYLYTPVAIIIAALIIGLALALPAVLVRDYELVASPTADGKLFAWRLNKRTGELKACLYTPDPLQKYDPAAARMLEANCHIKIVLD
jgi:hypothetical protein